MPAAARAFAESAFRVLGPGPNAPKPTATMSAVQRKRWLWAADNWPAAKCRRSTQHLALQRAGFAESVGFEFHSSALIAARRGVSRPRRARPVRPRAERRIQEHGGQSGQPEDRKHRLGRTQNAQGAADALELPVIFQQTREFQPS